MKLTDLLYVLRDSIETHGDLEVREALGYEEASPILEARVDLVRDDDGTVAVALRLELDEPPPKQADARKDDKPQRMAQLPDRDPTKPPDQF